MKNELQSEKSSVFGAMLVGGFGATAIAGTAWVITHVPWLGLEEQIAVPIILCCWLFALVFVASRVNRSQSMLCGLGAGLISGLSGLVFFGSRLGLAKDGIAGGLVPNAVMIAAGFVALGTCLGVAAGLIGRVLARERTIALPSSFWLGRFAIVTAMGALPLIFIGGMVTSTRSGMAVPDWPRSYGANMFLFPLSAHTDPGRYVEHSHRLFGTFVGLCSLVLLIWTFRSDRRGWVRALATIAFVLVCAQGVLGGLRVVLETRAASTGEANPERIGRLFAMGHGILGQLTLAMIATLPVVLSQTFRSLTPGQKVLDGPTARRLKFLCTLTLHSLILQLLLGAWYRHFHSRHVLYTHIAFSVLVLVGAALAGFTFGSERVRQSIVGPVVARLGMALALTAGLQFLLGWITFAIAGLTPDPNSIPQALTRTAHQANGGVFIALAAACYVWGRRLGRAGGAEPVATP